MKLLISSGSAHSRSRRPFGSLNLESFVLSFPSTYCSSPEVEWPYIFSFLFFFWLFLLLLMVVLVVVVVVGVVTLSPENLARTRFGRVLNIYV